MHSLTFDIFYCFLRKIFFTEHILDNSDQHLSRIVQNGNEKNRTKIVQVLGASKGFFSLSETGLTVHTKRYITTLLDSFLRSAFLLFLRAPGDNVR